MLNRIKLMTLLFGALVSFSFFSAPKASAQVGVGLRFGPAFNQLETTTSYDYDRHYKGDTYFSLSVPVRYTVNDWLSIEADPGLIQKGYQQTRYREYVENWGFSVRNYFLQLPIYTHFTFGGSRLRGFLNTGVFAGYWFKSHISGRQLGYFDEVDGFEPLRSYDEDVEFDSRRDRRIEAGLMAGIGLEYNITKQLQVGCELRYLYSLTDIQKNYMIGQFHRYNSTLTPTVGLMYFFTTK